MTTTIGWLHLSDLHVGMTDDDVLWLELREALFRDFEKLHPVCGPWDLVLFTGDIVQRGTSDEFARATERLRQIWDRLHRLGSDPVLVAVPGNHDLVRPDPALADVLALENWHRSGVLRRKFWTDAAYSSRSMVQSAFAAFTSWVATHPFPRLPDATTGLLPGDLSATYTKGAFAVGIVGLNSAFLQLRPGMRSGELAVDSCQFHAVCGGDGPGWVANQHVALLLTHHPPGWLAAPAREEYTGQVAVPGRFLAQLVGHMHQNRTETRSDDGAPFQRLWQASSLLGLRNYGEQRKRRRVHGYVAGLVVLDGTTASIRQWPRVAAQHRAGYLHFAADGTFATELDGSTREEKVAVLRPRAAVAAGAELAVGAVSSHVVPAKTAAAEASPMRVDSALVAGISEEVPSAAQVTTRCPLGPRLLWKRYVGVGTWRSEPVFLAGRVIFPVAGREQNTDDLEAGVVCLDELTGDEVWVHRTRSDPNSPCLLDERVLIVGTDLGRLHAIDALKGTEIWDVDVGGSVLARPVPTDAGLLVLTVSEAGGGALLVDPDDGEVLAATGLEDGVVADPVRVGDAIYIATRAGRVLAIPAKEPIGRSSSGPRLQLLGSANVSYPDEFSAVGSSRCAFHGSPTIMGDRLLLPYVRETTFANLPLAAVQLPSLAVLWCEAAWSESDRHFGNIRARPVVVGDVAMAPVAYGNEVAGVGPDGWQDALAYPLRTSLLPTVGKSWTHANYRTGPAIRRVRPRGGRRHGEATLVDLPGRS